MNDNSQVNVFYGLSYCCRGISLHIFEPRTTEGFVVHFNGEDTSFRRRDFRVDRGKNIAYLEDRNYGYGAMYRERFEQIVSAINGHRRFVPESELTLPIVFFKEDVSRFLEELEGMDDEGDLFV